MWKGNIVAGCEIALLHNQFNTDFGTCNNGAVVGRGVRNESNCYTSQLTVLVTPDLNGRTIECHSDDGVREILVNFTTLLLTRGILITYTQ